MKMLGTSEGTISLAFMVDYIDSEILKDINDFNRKNLLIKLNNYFNILQEVFSEDWPILIKTTGMGAMLMFYPTAEKQFGDLS